MAERRMFSKKIIDSDEFLDMPLAAQALYFHLSMQADDDGFISSPKKTLRSIGASESDMELLIKKKFIIAFDSGIAAVRHWKIHNCIKKDRYKESIYLEEKRQLDCDENGTYIKSKHSASGAEQPRSQAGTAMEPKWIQSGTKVDPEWIQNGSKVEPQVRLGKDSIDKDSLVKGRVGKESKEKERIEKINSGEGSINTPPSPHENKYEEDFSSEWAVAPFPTGKCLPEEQPRCEAHHLQEDQHIYEAYHSQGEQYCSPDDYISSDMSSRYLLEGETEVLFPYAEGRFEEAYRFAQERNIEKASRTGRGGTAGDGGCDAMLKPVEGAYGRGIVCLTDGQLADLKERLGEYQLNRYMDKLASFISSRGARIRSHYDTLIKWYEEDLKNENDVAKPQANSPYYSKPVSPPPEKSRYGNFDPGEAFRHALARTKQELELEMNEGLSED